MNLDKIKKALPKDSANGRRNVILNRPDVAEVVCDLVLGRRTAVDVAKRCGVGYETIMRFKNHTITDNLRKVVIAEAQTAESNDLDAKINSGQDDVQKGLRGIIDEQKSIYKLMKDKLHEGRDIEDIAPALSQLLRDQGSSFERLLKSYTALKDKTTVVLSINESPEWSKLQEVLYQVFEAHPDAFEMFQNEITTRRLNLE